MKILCIGGGPAGLYFSLLMKQQNPSHHITVVERNRPYDTFGWGVVLRDQTLNNFRVADPHTAQLIGDAFNHWDDIEVFFKGRSIRSTGHGFCGIGRKHLLNILQQRCEELGVQLVFETDVMDDQALAEQYQADLVIASDGLNSRIRTRYAESYQPDIDVRNCRFVWLGTHKTFDAFTFAFEQTEHGWFQAHAYKYDAHTSTFIVETPDAVWRAHGLDRMSHEEAIAFCQNLFAKYLDGHALMSNAAHLRGSAIWIQFPRVICKSWVHWTHAERDKPIPVVLMGDAAHTAHYSIGSGTKLALEDAIDLANTFTQHADADISTVLQAYEDRRSVEVLKIQNAARNSTAWFEHVDRYTHMDIEQFTYSLLTRSQRISHENLRLRITPGCPGLWDDNQRHAFKRITDFVHQNNAHIGLQLGHSGAKGSTQLGWDAIDEPLLEDNWPLMAASPIAYGPNNAVPRPMTTADMQTLIAQFVQATQRADAAGFDWLELHCAHGYLLSGFICPLTNNRTDNYGGSLANRCRYPLEVFEAMRAVWPTRKPMSVRISAHDWAPGGNTDDDAVEIARLFQKAGCDLIDVSSGQTTRSAKPVYGRMYQTPFSDRIRNELHIATMAVGAISEADHANSIVAAGRADLCAVARPHLADAAWTLHEVAKMGSKDIVWPRVYETGRDQLYRLLNTTR